MLVRIKRPPVRLHRNHLSTKLHSDFHQFSAQQFFHQRLTEQRLLWPSMEPDRLSNKDIHWPWILLSEFFASHAIHIKGQVHIFYTNLKDVGVNHAGKSNERVIVTTSCSALSLCTDQVCCSHLQMFNCQYCCSFTIKALRFLLNYESYHFWNLNFSGENFCPVL